MFEPTARMKRNPIAAKIVLEGYWDERIEEMKGNRVIYAYDWFTRRVLRLIHGRDNKLPEIKGKLNDH